MMTVDPVMDSNFVSARAHLRRNGIPMWFIILGVCAIVLASRKAFACSGLILGKDVSPTGCVVVGHVEDDGGRLLVRHGLVPARTHASGSVIVAEDGSARVPQASETFGFFWSEVRGERGLSNADVFHNDRGVCIVTDSCRDSRLDNEPDLIGGGIEYALRRILAERATSSAHGVQLAAEILDRYGYRGSGRTYLIADAREAWMLQIAQGRHFCAIRVRDDEAAFIPNHYTIRAGDLATHRFRMSDGLIGYARDRGWCDVDDASPERFDFARAFQDPSGWRKDVNTLRHRHALRLLTGREWDADGELPFGVRPERIVSRREVAAILRTHYEGTPDDRRVPFAGRSPHYTPIRRICSGTTVEGLIAELDEHPELTRLVIAQGHPCSAPFLPLHAGVSSLPESLDPMDDPAAELETHCAAKPHLLDADGKGWWRVRRRQAIIDLRWNDVRGTLGEWIASFETDIDAEEADVRSRARALFDEGRDSEARTILNDWAARIAEEAEHGIEAVLRPFVPADASCDRSGITRGDRSGELAVSFRCAGTPDEPSIRMGQDGVSHTLWATPLPGTLRSDGDGWTVRFRVRELTEAAVPCLSDFHLGGRDAAGRGFAARVTLRVLPSAQEDTLPY